MPMDVLAAHLGVKKSTIRTMMKHGGLPRPKQIGNITLWNWDAVNRWLLRGDDQDNQPEKVSDELLATRAKDIRKSMRRLHIVPKVPRDGGK